MINTQKSSAQDIVTLGAANHSLSLTYLTMNWKELVERREHKRFWAQGGAFAILRPHFYKQGQIMDVGTGGLAFRYTTSIEQPYEPFESDMSLDIFSPDYHTDGANVSFSLSELPIKIISDFEIARIPFGSIAQRRCGVQFEELTYDQKSKIEYFIQKYNIGEKQGCP
jgi:hypothetical protein